MFHQSYSSKSHKSNRTDSIENQSLPSLQVRHPHLITKGMLVNKNINVITNPSYSKNKESVQIVEKSAVKHLSQDIKKHHIDTKAYSEPTIDNCNHYSLKNSLYQYRQCSGKQNSPYIRKSTIKGSNSKSQRQNKGYYKLESTYEELEHIEIGPKSCIHLPKLQPYEAEYLQHVSEDDISAVKKYIEDHSTMNINCTNFQGISALHIALYNKSEAMLEFLLQHPNVDIGDTVLHAVRDNSIKLLVMLLDAQKKVSPGLEFAGATHSTDYPPYITPLILAAQLGHFEIVDLLLHRGHTIVSPHATNCSCVTCKNITVNDDSLHTCNARLSVYRAIASPAYLIHVALDPILDAFQLTAELAANAASCRQLATAYLQLEKDVSAFAVDLIGYCRTSAEVELILKQRSGRKDRRHFVLPRLLMALDYKQKEFVAHPNTQQVLEAYWLGDWHNWRCKSMLTKAIIIVSRVLVTPIILFVCMLAPRHRLVAHWQIPLNKLITHVAAYFVFLVLVFYISNQDKGKLKRGPPNTGVEAILILYVCGYMWSAIRMCLMQGSRWYFTKMWNWAEIIMLSLFGLTFAFWVAAAIDVAVNGQDDLERKYWNQYDPTLLAEGTFCLATVFAFFRLMFLCQLNYHLGPLQVSLGKMTIDIYKYIIVFTIIISAFAAGLARFYQYYDGMVYEDQFGMKTVQVSSFTSLTDTLNTLFWALFCMAPLESGDVVLENTRYSRGIEKAFENRHSFTERIGYFCFGCFEVISVIVVLNMLIATMSNTFQRVTDNVDIEWTFGKTEVYIDYMLQNTLPSPYNMIPTATGISNVVEWIVTKISKPKGLYARWSPAHCCYIERDVEASVQREFPALMSVLVQRYFRAKESTRMCVNGVESKLKVIRRDVASLKSEIEKRFTC